MAVGSAHVPVPDLAATTQVLAQEDGAYQPPEVEAETPAWIKPLAPLADLPLWAQAALASATLAVVVLVVLGGGRLAWRLITEQSFKSEADE